LELFCVLFYGLSPGLQKAFGLIEVNIDLNKTKSFLDTWGKTIEQYAKEFQEMTEELNTTK